MEVKKYISNYNELVHLLFRYHYLFFQSLQLMVDGAIGRHGVNAPEPVEQVVKCESDCVTILLQRPVDYLA